jgi:hypothetical protein
MVQIMADREHISDPDAPALGGLNQLRETGYSVRARHPGEVRDGISHSTDSSARTLQVSSGFATSSGRR